ncbi:MAG: cation:proton antiporter [Hyphomicrobium sp.]|jgi:CPA2 family monovalent cation:H+ antiporter-2
MVQPQDNGVLQDMMVFLAAAAVVVPLVQRMRVSPVLGFLLAGAVLGPHGLGAAANALPWLSWVSVSETTGLGAFGELGVVFLLFLVGLELPMQRLVTMRRLVFGLGGLQVAVSALALAAVAGLLGADARASTIIGLSLALSSTAIVVEVLAQQHRLRTAAGRASFSVLLLQDLAVVPLLLLVTILGTGQEGSILISIVTAFAQASLAVGFIVVVGTALLRPLFRLVASSENVELFVAATLLVAVGSGMLTASAGLSMALGAFVAGLLLAESEFRRAIETTIEPFKGLLLGLFFFTVGMSLDLEALATRPATIMAAVLGLVALKAAIVTPLMRLFRFSWPASVQAALLLGPAGEFAFIVLSLAMSTKLVPEGQGAFVVAVASISMAMIPLFDLLGHWLTKRLEARAGAFEDPALRALPPEETSARAIIVGYGRVGQLVSDMLDRHGIPHVVTERAAALVSEARSKGRPVYFGDGKNTQFLARCGLKDVHAVIITIHTWLEIDDLVRAVRSLHPKVVIVARARDADHARHLYELGVTDAVPETIEASLQLSEAALVGLGGPTGPVIASIHEKRDEFREALQGAIGTSGRVARGLRAKTKR